MTDRTFADAQDDAAAAREEDAHPVEAFDAAAYPSDADDAEHVPEARAVAALRDTLRLIDAQPDMTTHLRGMFARLVLPDFLKLADLFERQERTIEEQRLEVVRLTRFAERAEARDTRNQQQLIAAHDVIRSFGHALDGLVPLLEKLMAEHTAHEPPLTRRDILARNPADPVMGYAKADDAHTLR